jgi:hypothetical protein
MTLEEMIDMARQLCSATVRDDGELPCLNKRRLSTKSCTAEEEDRPLTRAEKAKGWARRPFFAYDTEAMCSHCRAYWYLSMAEIALRDAHVFNQRIAAAERADRIARESEKGAVGQDASGSAAVESGERPAGED